MAKSNFSSRRIELEEQFFLQRDMELLQALREKSAAKQMRKALIEASGIGDEQLIDRLIELELSGETVAALSLVPLIAVAWADGKIDDKERAAVLSAAEKEGLEQEGPCHNMLDRWLEKKPDAKLLEAWNGYVATLCETLDEAAKKTLKTELLGRARAVAAAAGGILGFGNKVSSSEQAVLDSLEAAFD